MRPLPYGRQSIEDDDISAVTAVMRGDWLTQGPTVGAFEDAFAARVGAAHAIAVNSGTAALHLAYLGLGLGPGDCVVVPTVTFLATASAAALCGAEVAFGDVDPETGLLRPADAVAAIERARSRGWRVKALAPVHLGGQTADLQGVAAVADAHGAVLVEDACHALGTRFDLDGAVVGGCAKSLAATFSFHPVKTIATGEGGMVTTNDPALAERMRQARSHGMVREPALWRDRAAGFDADGTPNPWVYEMPEPGLNYRMSDIQAALGLSQLGKLDRFVARRAALVAAYEALLAPLAPRVRPVARVAGCRPGWHLMQVLVDFAGIGRSRAKVMAGLKARGIGTQVHYIPVHTQPWWRDRYGVLELPRAAAFYTRTLSLPLFPAMTEADVARVVEALGAEIGG